MLPSESECRAIVERALRFATSDDATVVLAFDENGNTRFANNETTTSGETEGVRVVVRAIRDGRTGRVEINETGDDALREAFRRAEAQAALLPADPEYVGPLAPQKYLAVAAFDEPTARLGPADRIAPIRTVVGKAARAKLEASGFLEHESSVRCVANRAGNFGWFRSTQTSLSATARTPDGTGSGWANGTSHRVADVSADAIAARATEKGRTSARPQPIAPGDYTVVLEPAAVSGMLGAGFAQALSARAAEQGRSYFSKKGGGTLLGERLFHESVTLRTDPSDPRRPAIPWDIGGGFGRGFDVGPDYGLAVAPIAWIDQGVLANLSYDRYWAKRAERPATSGATNLILEGGGETLESLIASTDRGLLVTNFWYIRAVNPQTLQLTGLTRDGVWLIEGGKIVRPVVNLRFNESPAVLLRNVVGMTRAVRVGARVVPGIKATGFTFSSQSAAV